MVLTFVKIHIVSAIFLASSYGHEMFMDNAFDEGETGGITSHLASSKRYILSPTAGNSNFRTRKKREAVLATLATIGVAGAAYHKWKKYNAQKPYDWSPLPYKSYARKGKTKKDESLSSSEEKGNSKDGLNNPKSQKGKTKKVKFESSNEEKEKPSTKKDGIPRSSRSARVEDEQEDDIYNASPESSKPTKIPKTNSPGSSKEQKSHGENPTTSKDRDVPTSLEWKDKKDAPGMPHTPVGEISDGAPPAAEPTVPKTVIQKATGAFSTGAAAAFTGLLKGKTGPDLALYVAGEMAKEYMKSGDNPGVTANDLLGPATNIAKMATDGGIKDASTIANTLIGQMAPASLKGWFG